MLILVFSEIIPKTLGANYWERLAPLTVRCLKVLIVLLYPLVWLLLTRVLHPPGTAGEVVVTPSPREHHLLAEEVGLALLAEAGLDDTGATATDGRCIGERDLLGTAGCVLGNGDQVRDTVLVQVAEVILEGLHKSLFYMAMTSKHGQCRVEAIDVVGH